MNEWDGSLSNGTNANFNLPRAYTHLSPFHLILILAPFSIISALFLYLGTQSPKETRNSPITSTVSLFLLLLLSIDPVFGFLYLLWPVI